MNKKVIITIVVCILVLALGIGAVLYFTGDAGKINLKKDGKNKETSAVTSSESSDKSGGSEKSNGSSDKGGKDKSGGDSDNTATNTDSNNSSVKTNASANENSNSSSGNKNNDKKNSDNSSKNNSGSKSKDDPSKEAGKKHSTGKEDIDVEDPVVEDNTVTVPIYATKNKGMAAARMFVEFDTKAFEYADVLPGDIFNDCTANFENGRLTIVATTKDTIYDISGAGVIANVVLVKKSGAKSGTYEVTVGKDSEYANYDGELVKPTVEVGKIKIK